MATGKFKFNRKNYNIFKEQVMVKAINATAHEVMNEIAEAGVVPYDTGNLQERNNKVGKATLGKKIAYLIWTGVGKLNLPFAKRLYYHPEFKFKNGRKGRWADDWIVGSKRKNVLKTYEDALRKVLK